MGKGIAMKNYRMIIWNNNTKEAELVMEMQRPRFTKQEYDMAVAEMFFLAAQNCDYSSLRTEVQCDGNKVLELTCETRADYPSIDALIYANGTFVRNMAIAY